MEPNETDIPEIDRHSVPPPDVSLGHHDHSPTLTQTCVHTEHQPLASDDPLYPALQDGNNLLDDQVGYHSDDTTINDEDVGGTYYDVAGE